MHAVVEARVVRAVVVADASDEELRLQPRDAHVRRELVEHDAKKWRGSDSGTPARFCRTESSRTHSAGLVLLDSGASSTSLHIVRVCETRGVLATGVAELICGVGMAWK